jgi:signal transduction histidine kinase
MQNIREKHNMFFHPYTFLNIISIGLTVIIAISFNKFDMQFSDFPKYFYSICILNLIVPMAYFLYFRPIQKYVLKSLIQEVSKKKDLETINKIERDRRNSLNLLASGVAHEINNPLAILLGHVEHIKKYVSLSNLLSERMSKYFNIVEASGQRIERITQNLRFYAQDSEKEEHGFVCVKALFDRISDFFTSQTLEFGINLEILFDKSNKNLTYLKCKECQLGHAILNIINNSIEAVKSNNGEKWIRIVVSPVEEAGEVVIKIIDSGLGIPKDISDKIMQPFFTTKDIGKGTGLGLSAAQGIIAEHAGTLEYLDEAKNTTFKITLPVCAHEFHEGVQNVN